MKLSSLLLTLTPVLLLLTACHENERHYPSYYDTEYIGANDYKIIAFTFTPGTTYHVQLKIFSGDADLAILNNSGDYIVYSDENGTTTDEVIFTADEYHYDLEIYGYYHSEYRLIIDDVPYYETGLDTTADSIEFTIETAAFSGDLYTVLASKSIDIHHDYDHIIIQPSLHQSWLNVIPAGVLTERNAIVDINILETANPAAHNYAYVRIVAEDYHGKIRVFQDIDIVYNVVDTLP